MRSLRPTTLIAGLGVALLVTATLVVAGSLSQPTAAHAADPAGVNPMTVNGGFTVYATQNASLGNSEFEGSLAVGNQLTMTQAATYQMAHVIAGTGAYVLPTVDNDPTRLLIGTYAPGPTNVGQIEITNAGATAASQRGDFKVVTRGGGFGTVQRGSWVRYGPQANPNAVPLIDAENQPYNATTTNPPTTSAGNGSIFTYQTGADTASVVADYVEANAQADAGGIEQCLGGLADPSTGLAHQVTISENVGDRIVLGPLATDQPNVVNYSDISGAGLVQFSSDTPGPSNPLIIRVPAGVTDISAPRIDPQGTYSPYVLWDLSALTGAVSIHTGGRGDGSIFAPNVSLAVSAQPWDGQVYAQNFSMSGGESHSYMFAGFIPCDTGGPSAGDFTVSKALSGVTASDLVSGATFSVDYTATLPDSSVQTGTLTLSPDGTPVGPASDFPFGTKVAVTEVPPADSLLSSPGLAWSGVSWSGDTTFTIDATHPSVALTVTNTARTVSAGFAVTKVISGSAATSVPSGTEFPLEYSLDGGTTWLPLTVSPDRAAEVDGLTPGATVRIREGSPLPEVAGVTWGEPVWKLGTPTPLPRASDGAVEFTLIPGAVVHFTLTNEANGVGSFALSKSVVGNASSAVPDGASFPVTYSYGDTTATVDLLDGQTVTVPDVPTGTTVTVSEGTPPAVPGVVWSDPGWNVDGVPVSPDADGALSFVVTTGTTVGVQLTNTATGFGALTITKTVTGPGASSVPADTTFTVQYRVGGGVVQSLLLSPGAAVTAGRLPTGVPVTMREGTMPSIDDVSWGTPVWTVDGQPLTPDAEGWITFTPETGQLVTIGLQNIATPLGNFTVAKALSGVDASGLTSGATFTVDYTATLPDGTSRSGTLTLSPDGTPVGPTDPFPYGTRIDVSETPPADSLLTDPDMGWTDASWSGNTSFTIDADTPSPALTVTNTASVVTAGFSVTKEITGSGATAVPSDTVFPLQYSLDGGTTWIDLNVSPQDLAEVPGLTAGASVAIREVMPLPSVDGVSWGNPVWQLNGTTLPQAADGSVTFALLAGATVELTLTNQSSGVASFTIAKTITGDAASLIRDETDFPVTYTFGDTSETVGVHVGDSLTVDDVPTGETVTVSEGEPPNVPNVEWGTPSWTIDDVPIAADPDGSISFVAETATAVSIGLTNRAQGLGGFAVTKTVSGSGASQVPDNTAFALEYRIADGDPFALTVTPSTAATVVGLPVGEPIFVRETALPSIPNIQWGTVSWTLGSTPLTPDSDGWVSVTLQTGATLALGLHNVADLTGGFDVTKTIKGDEASLVPDGSTFTVRYSVDGGAEQSLDVIAGSPTSVTGLADGASVTFTEATPPSVPGVTWGTPTWTVGGHAVSDPTITVTGGESVAVGLTNTAKESGGGGGGGGQGGGGPGPNGGGILWDTGSNVDGALWWGLGLLGAGALALIVVIRRRRRV